MSLSAKKTENSKVGKKRDSGKGIPEPVLSEDRVIISEGYLPDFKPIWNLAKIPQRMLLITESRKFNLMQYFDLADFSNRV